ncbi:MAG: tetratricopeptide repeat protein [Deltaproteobacteria bacterium]|nr:tetratricopeptide repeat protein [Deltaproteobacteria bacterium]
MIQAGRDRCRTNKETGRCRTTGRPSATWPFTRIVPSRPEFLATEPTPPSRASTGKHARHDAAAPPPARITPAAPTFTTLFDEGGRLFRSGRYRQAQTAFEHARTLHPSSASVYRYLGKCATRLGQHRRAKKAYRRYLKLRPNANDAPIILNIIMSH